MHDVDVTCASTGSLFGPESLYWIPVLMGAPARHCTGYLYLWVFSLVTM